MDSGGWSGGSEGGSGPTGNTGETAGGPRSTGGSGERGGSGQYEYRPGAPVGGGGYGRDSDDAESRRREDEGRTGGTQGWAHGRREGRITGDDAHVSGEKGGGSMDTGSSGSVYGEVAAIGALGLGNTAIDELAEGPSGSPTVIYACPEGDTPRQQFARAPRLRPRCPHSGLPMRRLMPPETDAAYAQAVKQQAP